MTVSRILKIIGYVHATLLLALLIPFLYAVIGLLDSAGAGALYGKCLLIAIPVIVTERAAKRTKYLAGYLAVCAVLLAGVCGAAVLLNAPGAYTVGYGLGMSAETVFLALKRLAARLAEAPGRKEKDPLAAKKEEFLDTPSLSCVWYFVVIYVLGLFLQAEALCDMAFYSAIVYFFPALAAVWFYEVRSYLELNKRISGIPTRRLYGIGLSMLLALSLLLLVGMLPSVFLAGSRRYIDMRGWFDGAGFIPYEEPEPMVREGAPEGGGMMEMLNVGEPLPEPSVFANVLFGVLAGVCILVSVVGIVLAIRQAFRDFKDSRDGNGDLIEEIREKERSDREELFGRRAHRTESAAEKIRRRYRKMIRKHRKEKPAPHESPAEIEEAAGLRDDVGMRQLHEAYEEARYGKQ
ncbi:MAG: hypothetical protein NC302_08565 [Bacteroidales bacterium]|nr:hypothetical protein [Bacteroidales bacterium]MCM1417020.1 hypothetical protein [bacterium]MCM1424557.1 hypothetical protein [bacterium]